MYVPTNPVCLTELQRPSPPVWHADCQIRDPLAAPADAVHSSPLYHPLLPQQGGLKTKKVDLALRSAQLKMGIRKTFWEIEGGRRPVAHISHRVPIGLCKYGHHMPVSMHIWMLPSYARQYAHMAVTIIWSTVCTYGCYHHMPDKPRVWTGSLFVSRERCGHLARRHCSAVPVIPSLSPQTAALFLQHFDLFLPLFPRLCRCWSCLQSLPCSGCC